MSVKSDNTKKRELKQFPFFISIYVKIEYKNLH